MVTKGTNKVQSESLGHGIIGALEETYGYMLRARILEKIEQDFTARGEAFFYVSGAGHEGLATLSHHLIQEDYLHCHYRDKSLMLARGMPEEDFFLTLFNKGGSFSSGRQMNGLMGWTPKNILSMPGPVGNSTLQAVGVASVIKSKPANPLVVCSMGEGSTQQGEAMEAFSHAVRDSLPVLFIIQDNTFAISTSTEGRTFYSLPTGDADTFLGIPIIRINGRNPQEYYETFGNIVADMRKTRKPAFVVFSIDRLQSHTNADNHAVYRSEEDIQQIRSSGDPLANLKSYLLENGTQESALDAMEQEITERYNKLVYEAQTAKEPRPTFTAFSELDAEQTSPSSEFRGTGSPELTMLEAIRENLDNWLLTDERVTLYGEDIEDPKGDVFGVTRGLSTKYSDRVKNSPLSEALIVGLSIGRALAGMRPVALIQFADFIPLVMNQIYSEMGNLYWRTGGKSTCPLIIMAPCGGYSPGLGPFHAASMESFVSHVPGINVVIPTTAADAAGLMNACYKSGRPSIVFYPKVLLNSQHTRTSKDVGSHFVPLGVARVVEEGSDISFITYGNGLTLAKKAAATLKKSGVLAEIIDLRSIVPWDKKAVITSARKTKKVIVCSEDNRTSSFAGEVVATIAEACGKEVEIRRIVREDTYIPCNYANQIEVLPSFKQVLTTAVDMLEGSIEWEQEEAENANVVIVKAIGSSPSDESVTVIEWKCKIGDSVKEGDVIAELEADKSAIDLRCPSSGVVEKVLLDEGDIVSVGTPILQLSTSEKKRDTALVTKENPGVPIITGLRQKPEESQYQESVATSYVNPGIVAVEGVTGSRIVENAEIAKHLPDWDSSDIIKRTGIERRNWIGPGETALTMAVEACKKLFKNQEITLLDIDAIVCSTGTPISYTPSMSTRIHYELAKDISEDCEVEAYDISAACSGYLYGLKVIYDDLMLHPDKRVLLVTTEVLSQKVDVKDPGTAPIFADAATATLLVGSAHRDLYRAELFSPTLSAKGSPSEYLLVPSQRGEYIKMNGQYVFREAVQNMMKVLAQACELAKIRINQLHLLVPHQANQRIINMIRQKLHMSKEQVFSNIRELGNTSSSTIPLCLQTLFGQPYDNTLFGLVAFGGGLTYGSAVIKLRNNSGRAPIMNTESRTQKKKLLQGALKKALDRIKKTPEVPE